MNATTRRWAWPAALVVAVLLTVGLSVLTLPRTRGGELDPDSARPEGTRAVAQILRAQGVDVRVARHRAELATGYADRDTTVLVVQPELAPLAVLDRLRSARADLVLVQPDQVTLDRLGIDVLAAGEVAPGVAEPGCSNADAAAAGAATAGGRLYQGRRGWRTCYLDRTDPGRGAVVVTGSVVTGSERRVAVLGQPDVLRNGTLAQQGNAALALRLLGHRRSLLWYLPDPTELTARQAPGLSSLLPPWVRWVTLQLGLAALVALLWRGRRLGRLVAEPLPVIVRAAETQEGRARLYRSGGGRGGRARAAAILRTAALRRLARRFDAGPGTPAEVVADLAGPAGRAVLLGPPPADDGALVRLATQIDRIEQDVSR